MHKIKRKSKPTPKSKSKKSKQKNKTQAITLTKKEKQALKRQQTKERKELVSTLIPTLIAAFAIGAGISLKNSKLGIAAGGGLLLLILSFKYPRQALWMFLMYLPISGTVTYAIGGGNAAFQFAKDAFYFPALFSFVQNLRRDKLPLVMSKKLITPLAILLGVCLLTMLFVNGYQQIFPQSIPIFDPYATSRPTERPIIMGILGLKILLGYIPLITCGYYLIRSKKEFLFLTRMHVVLAIVACGLGLLQYLLLAKGTCVGTRMMEGQDLYKPSLSARCLVGGSVAFSSYMTRLPGTFVSPWHWAWFLISNTFFTFASAFSDPSFLWQLASFSSLALILINAVVSGQRIALIAVPIIIVILLILTGQIANLKRFLPIASGIGILATIGLVMFPTVVEERIKSLVDRWNASPPDQFIASQVQFTVEGQAGLLGKGLGRATNSARTLGQTKLIETWFPKLLFEIGPVGLIGFLIFVTALTWACFKAYRSLKERHLRSFGACFWVFVLFVSYNPYWYPLDTDPVAVYYWFFAGVILKLPELDRQEQEELLTSSEKSLFLPKKKRFSG
ncbi:MAG TPA: hormogonium polysaccharide biosynthesis protein HpsL [Halomicronema sp.]